MSERLTDVSLPGESGLADWGRKTPAEMIAQLRDYAQRQKDAAEKILAAKDEDFRVRTYLGPYAMRKMEILQPGK